MRGADPTIHLSVDAVCSILKECSTSGVSELKFRDLHVRFGSTAGPVVDLRSLRYPLVQQPQGPQPEVADLTPEQHAENTKLTLELEELRMREEKLARALVEDPLEYERMLRDGELSDDVESSDESDE